MATATPAAVIGRSGSTATTSRAGSASSDAEATAAPPGSVLTISGRPASSTATTTTSPPAPAAPTPAALASAVGGSAAAPSVEAAHAGMAGATFAGAGVGAGAHDAITSATEISPAGNSTRPTLLTGSPFLGRRPDDPGFGRYLPRLDLEGPVGRAHGPFGPCPCRRGGADRAARPADDPGTDRYGPRAAAPAGPFPRGIQLPAGAGRTWSCRPSGRSRAVPESRCWRRRSRRARRVVTAGPCWWTCAVTRRRCSACPSPGVPGVRDWLATGRSGPDALQRLLVPAAEGLSLLPCGSPSVDPWEPVRAEELADALLALDPAVVIDAGRCGGPSFGTAHDDLVGVLGAHGRSYLVTRPCYVALRRGVTRRCRCGRRGAGPRAGPLPGRA